MKKLLKQVEEYNGILNFPIVLMLGSGVEFDDSTASYQKDKDVALAITPILFSIKSSISSLITLANQPLSKMMAKNCLPIARSVVEGCVNVVYIMSQGSDVAKDAMEHALAKGYRNTEQSVGSGSFGIKLTRFPRMIPSDSLNDIIEKFTSKKGRPKNWTNLSVLQRIEEIEPVFGGKCAAGLAGTYLMIYSDASEIVHGSLTGAMIANGTLPFNKPPKEDEEHIDTQRMLLEGAIFASSFSLFCAIKAFSDYSGINQLDKMNSSGLESIKNYLDEENGKIHKTRKRKPKR